MSPLAAAMTAAAEAAQADLPRADEPAAHWATVFLTHCPATGGDIPHARLWALAGLLHALGNAYQNAWRARGRAIVNTTFQLHALLGQAGAKGYALELDAGPPLAKPYAALMTALGAEPAPRALVLRWIDVLNERLTMHRYADPGHRARQAAALLVAPLGLQSPADSVLPELAETCLATHDLLYAAEQAPQGWNRIELPHARQMGGFYSLADEARPPDADSIERARTALLERIAGYAPALGGMRPDWLRESLAATLRGAGQLASLAPAAPPADPKRERRRRLEAMEALWGPHRPRVTLLGRLKDLLT